ncbi:DUF3955 domain-containing protein [Vibrio splendidus]|uniref:DUF3955 domain-containing protein n=1 Tax=Vibrio splendidus TaxID=29497 RepID=UPI000C8193C5|nr:DUF3955 domain-containing protein [Vibrio splendidus]PMI79689.1 hypothetical protein BCU37_18045 [Vibrio splendidus]PMK60043.1 hypothetical protein BCT96_14895 [Vibrio splendidus]
MNFLRKYKISFLFCASGLLCFVAYHTIGSYVDENGLLVEPFGLIPLFWIFGLLALVASIVTFVKNRKVQSMG